MVRPFCLDLRTDPVRRSFYGDLMTTTLKQNLLDLSDFAWQRLRDRVKGLTDEEYFWEPFDGCWTVRKTETGFAADWAWIPPEPAPFTTLAWRITHIVDILQEERTATWLGHQPAADDGEPPVPESAEAALAALDHAYDVWRRRLAALSQDDLDRPMGEIAGPWAEHDGTAFVLHILDELIHHGAEVGHRPRLLPRAASRGPLRRRPGRRGDAGGAPGAARRSRRGAAMGGHPEARRPGLRRQRTDRGRQSPQRTWPRGPDRWTRCGSWWSTARICRRRIPGSAPTYSAGRSGSSSPRPSSTSASSDQGTKARWERRRKSRGESWWAVVKQRVK